MHCPWAIAHWWCWPCHNAYHTYTNLFCLTRNCLGQHRRRKGRGVACGASVQVELTVTWPVSHNFIPRTHGIVGVEDTRDTGWWVGTLFPSHLSLPSTMLYDAEVGPDPIGSVGWVQIQLVERLVCFIDIELAYSTSVFCKNKQVVHWVVSVQNLGN